MAKITGSMGDFVQTIHGINGVLIDAKSGYRGGVAFIETSDMRTFCCSADDVILHTENEEVRL